MRLLKNFNALRSAKLFLVVSIVTCCFVTGCGTADSQPRVSVYGDVFATGVTDIDGYVAMTPIQGGPACGATVERGKFQVAKHRGPIPGLYRAILTVRKMKMDPATPTGTSLPKSFRVLRLKIPEDGGKLTLRFVPTQD